MFNFTQMIHLDDELRDPPKTYRVYILIKDAIKHQWFLDDRFLFKDDNEGYVYFDFYSSKAANVFYKKMKELNIYSYTNFILQE
jgi:hypothetical protein